MVEFSKVNIVPDASLGRLAEYNHDTDTVRYNPDRMRRLSENARWFVFLHEMAHSMGIVNPDEDRIEAREMLADAFAIDIMINEMEISPEKVDYAVFTSLINILPIERRIAARNLINAYKNGTVSGLNKKRFAIAEDAFYEGAGGLVAFSSMPADVQAEALAEFHAYADKSHGHGKEKIAATAKAIGAKFAQYAAEGLRDGNFKAMSSQANAEAQKNKMLIWAGVGIVAVLIIVFTIVIVRRKK